MKEVSLTYLYFIPPPQVSPSLAKVLLHAQNWESADIEKKYRQNPSKLLEESRIQPAKKVHVVRDLHK